MISLSFEAIGTHWSIEVTTLQKNEHKLYLGIKNRIEAFDKVYSRFREDSLVTLMARKAGQYELPPDSVKLLVLYEDLYRKTDGFFTPLIGQQLSQAGYDQNYSFTSRPLTDVAVWDQVMEVNKSKISLKTPTLLDFGAAGKGYLVDLLSEYLEEHGITSYCIDAGGDIRHRNTKNIPLTVGLENPTDTKTVVGTVTLNNKSICGSAGNRRRWGAYHHILNPKTLQPVSDILATWVIADTTLVADALATCLFFVSPETLEQAFQYEYAILYSDYSVKFSPFFQNSFFSS